MSSPSVTTTGGFIRRVEDITFHGARLQSEVAKEIADEMGEIDRQEFTHVPTSLTPSSIISFFEERAESPSVDKSERRVYLKAIELIKDRSKLQAEVKSLNDRLSRYISSDEGQDSTEGEQ